MKKRMLARTLLLVASFLVYQASAAAAAASRDWCEEACEENQLNCINQNGTISDDCTGTWINGECDYKLTCVL